MKTSLQLIIVSVLSSFASVLIYTHYFNATTPTLTTPQAQQVKQSWHTYDGNNVVSSPWKSSAPTNFITASAKSTPAVVFIEAKQNAKYNFWMGGGYAGASGSGVIISSDGYVVTNNHVIEDADVFKVILNNNREYEGHLIGTDPTTDIALLKIDADSLQFLSFGNSDSLQIGEWVLAVGNPLRLQSTVTAGIVSAMGRNINILNNQKYSIESFIQTDAVVNPGNSGGALVNTMGELIGINTAIITNTGQYEGYSFAVPSNLARKVVNDLSEYGTVQRGLLGVQISAVTVRLAEELGLPSIEGVYIGGVFPNGAAADALLKTGDVILGINGIPTPSVPLLQEQVARFRPGHKITIEYFRDGARNITEVTLKNQINSTEPIVVHKEGILQQMGIQVRDLSTSEKKLRGINGVKILSIKEGSVIDRINMIPEYIVTHINGEKVENAEHFITLLQDSENEIRLEGYYENYEGAFPYTFTKSSLPK